MTPRMPTYASNAISNQGQNNNPFASLFSGGGLGSSIGQFLSGLFGNSGSPYEAASGEYKKYFNDASKYQMPFYNAGTGALPAYQEWLTKMKDPTKFINDAMGSYESSPWAQNLQRDALRSSQNAASASGLSGSTPMLMQMQQNAADISSKDQNQWLQNVLGINTQYGAGQKGLIDTGQISANNLSSMQMELAKLLAESAYGQEAGNNQDFWNLISGGLGLFGNAASLFG